MKNKLHTPSSDGCGSMGMKIDTEYLPSAQMATCCDAHDICYDTCNSDKELCDLDFKRCLYKYCDTFEKSTAGDVLIKSCKAAAKMLFTGTMTLGCKSYQDAQERACFCPPANNQYQQKNGKYNGKKPKDKKGYGYKSNDEI
jgi:secretory phospholipase A2